jgi:hypothetical protein
MATRAPVTGFVYTSTATGENATSVAGFERTGEACVASVLGVAAFGDASIAAAAKQGGLSMISAIDTSQFSILGIYASHCTLVRGK